MWFCEADPHPDIYKGPCYPLMPTILRYLDALDGICLWANLHRRSPAYEPAVDLWSNTIDMEIPSTYSPSLFPK